MRGMRGRSARSGRAVLIVLPVALLIAGGGGYLVMTKTRARGKQAKPEQLVQLPIEEMVVNLADTDRPRYLTTSITLVIAGQEPEGSIAEKEAQIRDAVLMVISGHKYRDLLPAEGKDALKAELASVVSAALEKDGLAVKEVLFTSFLME